MKSILLIDTLWEGHHPTYMKFIAKTLLDLGHVVVSACPDPHGMYAWIENHCTNWKSRFESVALYEPDIRQLFNHSLQARALSLARWQQAAQCVQARKALKGLTPDLVFFPWLDSYLGLTPSIVDHVFPYKWTGLFFQPRYSLRPHKLGCFRLGFLNPIAVLHAKGCQMVAIQDETITKGLQDRLRKPIITFPDFTDESIPNMDFTLVQEILDKAAGRKIIGLIGSLERRKGMLTLLQAAQQMGNHWFFVFAGKFADTTFTREEIAVIKSIIQANPGNCLFHLKRIPTEAQFNAVVQSCDVIYAAYENFQSSSNLLTKAALFKKIMITGEKYCIGERVRKYKLGYTIGESDVMGCINVLNRLYNETSAGVLSFKPDFDGYRERHSIAQLKNALEISLQCFRATHTI